MTSASPSTTADVRTASIVTASTCPPMIEPRETGMVRNRDAMPRVTSIDTEIAAPDAAPAIAMTRIVGATNAR
nr:hypothetical protein [Luteimicrobium album]